MRAGELLVLAVAFCGFMSGFVALVCIVASARLARDEAHRERIAEWKLAEFERRRDEQDRLVAELERLWEAS